MKKKILALCLVVVLVATAITGVTLAYFTDTDDATNTFTVGNVDIDLTEPKWDEQGKNEAPEAYPGEALAKDPTVTNHGANPCFVRISVTGWDCLAPAGDITYRTDYVDGKLGEKWAYNEADGYFYYTEPLAAGATTDALFDQIVMPTDLTNGYTGNYSLVVNAYAVQAQGARPSWSAVQTMTVEEIAAWFGTTAHTEWAKFGA